MRVREVPERFVLRKWAALYMQGKHRGFPPPNMDRYAGKSPVWVHVALPHDAYDADWNSPGGGSLTSQQVQRAHAYAATPGPLPPGMASYSERAARRRSPRVFVSDGNHRAHAAYLRGERTASFYMPLPDWERFSAVHGARRKNGLRVRKNDGSRAVARYYANECGYRKMEVRKLFKKGKPPKQGHTALNPQELEVYNRVVAADTRMGDATKTILLLLPLTGMRIGEAVALRREDIGPASLHVLGVKVVKRRNIPLDPEAKRILDAYLARHPVSSGRIFPVACTGDAQRALRRLRRVNAGLPSTVSPHALRHTYATQAVRRCVPPEKLQAALGHKSLRVTLIYLHGLGAL